jgi:ABC-2 type transport system ATP-binding protein
VLSSEKILEVAGLRKSYKGVAAVDEVSFRVGTNEIVGLLGPNGAGKTTTINMILGVLTPDTGTITIDGIDLFFNRAKALSKTNFSAVYAELPGNLTVYQNLFVFGMLYEVKNLKTRIEALLKEFDLEPFRNTKYGVLSSGEKMRVNLAKAFLNTPRLLLLDEPTASLDPAMAQEIRQRICAFVQKEKSGVLWTSHNMYEVEEVCHRVLFLSHGKILLEGNPKTLPKEYGKENLEELFISVAREPLFLGAS